MKMLILSACLVAIGDGTMRQADVNDTVDVADKADALLLARTGRAKYLASADDPTAKQGAYLTATADDKARAKLLAERIAAERDARVAARPLTAADVEALVAKRLAELAPAK